MRGIRRTLAFLTLFSCVMIAADSVRSLFNKGVKAEARQDYEAAYEFYKAAYNKHPDDLKYRVPYERIRFLAAASKVRRAQKLRELGRMQEALELFQKASEIDPSSDIAIQEVRRTKEMMSQPAGQGKTGPEAAPPTLEPDELHRRLEEAGGPVRLSPLSNVPLQVKMTADSKGIYETIGKIAGINVLFDPDYTSRRLLVDLQGVTLQQALDIVGLESRTFWRPVTPNTIFVAADSQAKRRELEQSVIKTFYLGNVSTPTDLQDVVNTIRTILEVQRIQQIPSQNAIVVRGTPDQLVLAQKMIDDIDKSKPEVIVEVLVAQVRRDKVRQLGIVPPAHAMVSLLGSNTTPATPGGTTPPATGTGAGLNFNTLQHLNSTNYSVTIDSVTAQAIFSDNNTKILQNPQIRAGDGVKASLKIGDRIPVATGSFGTPVGIAGVGNLGVNTQFQYIDVGVNIDLTPHVHPDGEISLKVVLDISSQTGTASLGNITQPIISQRKVDQEIRLRDGEVNLLGGILEEQETANASGAPFLAQIPLLKYLFSNNDKEKHTNEIVFMLVPHIIRGQELSNTNRRTFDVGTGTGIDLRMAEKPTKPDAAKTETAKPVAQPATLTPVSTSSAPVKPAPPVEQPAPGAPTLRLEPSTATPARGSSFGLSVVLSGGQDISTVPLQIVYDPKIMQFITVSTGDFLAKDGQPVALVHRDDPAAGTLQVMAQRSDLKGVSGEGVVFNMIFTAKAPGSGVIRIANPAVKNSQNQVVQFSTTQSAVTIN
ncbi:MAG TPA: cohesin domain-containing protein [Candidatus Saccharimonadales bacterium]|jgi:general secretion pathway protein D|nr:cohesin domain-containing protein [Candidatus Saccharimonadales bacterium]